MTTIAEIQKLSQERQQLYRIAGRNAGMNETQRKRCWQISARLKQLWHQYRSAGAHCCGMFCCGTGVGGGALASRNGRTKVTVNLRRYGGRR